MKNLVLVLSTVLLVSTAQASTSNAEFFAENLTLETNLCLIAAQDGFKAAKKEAKSTLLHNLKCNGVNIKDFAKMYKPAKSTQPVASTSILNNTLLVPADHNKESKLCVKAAKSGYNSIRFAAKGLKCNGEDVSRFVRSLKNI